jgi:hypothetical protein
MPATAALIATLITERPLCLDCICEKAGYPRDEVLAYLQRVQGIVQLHRAVDRCRGCGQSTEVVSMFRADDPRGQAGSREG